MEHRWGILSWQLRLLLSLKGVLIKEEKKGGGGYLASALGGYCLGCFLCEVTNSGGGQPALLLLVPSMFATVFATAAWRGELAAIWK